MDRGDRSGAKLHFAEKQMKLSENKENEKPLLAAARRKRNPNLEKGILKAKSPGKKLRDQRRLNQFKAKRRLSFGFGAATDNCQPEEKGSGTEDSGNVLNLLVGTSNIVIPLPITINPAPSNSELNYDSIKPK